MTIADLISRLEAARQRNPDQWSARCPAHDDQRRSLDVGSGRDGRILVRCHAGCSAEAITAALALDLKDLMPPPDPRAERARIAATYDYRDERGRLIYQVVRLEPKSFRGRMPNGCGGWIWSLKGVRRVLYRLPGLLASQGGVCFVEGEKDADALHDLGLCATTIAGGAGRPVDPEILTPLLGRPVAVFPDQDIPGRLYADSILAHIPGAFLCAITDPNCKDISDWISRGATAEDVRELIRRSAWRAEIGRRMDEVTRALCARPVDVARQLLLEIETKMK